MMQTEKASVTTKLLRAMSQVSYWPRTGRLVWEAAPAWTAAWGAILVVQGILPLASVYLTKLLVDSLVVTMGRGTTWDNVGPTLVLAALTAGAMLAIELFQGLMDWIRTGQSELIQDHIKSLVHRQSAAVDVSFYESAWYHDKLEQARNDAAGRPLALLESVGGLVQSGITLLAMAALLIPYGAWLPLVLLGSTLPALYVVLRFDRAYHKWWERTTVDRRWTTYYDAVLTERVVAAELRLFGLGDHFHLLYQALRRRMRTERLRLMKNQSAAKLGAGIGALLVMGATMAWMVLRAAQGAITLGDLVLFYQALQRGQGLLRAMLGNLGQIYSNTLFLGNLFAFLDFKPEITCPTQPVPCPSILKDGIYFRDVTFRYPGSERAALRDFNLTIPAGKIVSIVGPNGAGKTTLMKLLCRFYDPESGYVKLDGIDLRDLSHEELRRRITVLFQFPIGYITTARENITLGDLRSTPSAQEVEAAARAAGAHDMIAKFPQGYDTLLGKSFMDGVELSGGEWQRVAMARAFLRKAPIIVLDEPTSNMDSWAEADWFERFRELAQGRTAIIITHRFTIAMRADVIHVMSEGQIVESGSHHELLAQAGRYAESWDEQMKASCSGAERNTTPGSNGHALQDAIRGEQLSIV